MSAGTEPGHGRRGRLLVHVPFLLVMLVVAAGIGRIVLYHWRDGTVLIGAALVLAAGLRLVLPNGRAGLIAIRSRAVDVLLYGVLGLVVMLVSMSIQGGPLH